MPASSRGRWAGARYARPRVAWAAADELPRARQERRSGRSASRSRPRLRVRKHRRRPPRPIRARVNGSLSPASRSRPRTRIACGLRCAASWRHGSQSNAQGRDTDRRAAVARHAATGPPAGARRWRSRRPPRCCRHGAIRAGQGRDSFGRGLDAGSIAAVVAGDGAMRREREAHGHYLQGAYREPLAARAALHELVKQEGWAKAAQEVARDPAQFGELHGKEGWLASAKAKQGAGAGRARGRRAARQPAAYRRGRGRRQARLRPRRAGAAGAGRDRDIRLVQRGQGRAGRGAGRDHRHPAGTERRTATTRSYGGGRRRSRGLGPPGGPPRR